VALLAVMVPASIAGFWLFSLQHRFEGASWARHEQWDAVTAAIAGSSLLRLPRLLQWFTGSIGGRSLGPAGHLSRGDARLTPLIGR
jgi:omega-6 fatty acid desaturase (delta-12 desaturase)